MGSWIAPIELNANTCWSIQDVVLRLTALKKNVHFAKVDYSSPDTTELCQKFMLTDAAIPSIYHVAQ